MSFHKSIYVFSHCSLLYFGYLKTVFFWLKVFNMQSTFCAQHDVSLSAWSRLRLSAFRSVLLTLAFFIVVCTLLVLPGQGHAQTNTQCYDPQFAQTVAPLDWSGCAGMYIVRDRAELAIAATNGFQITSGDVSYTFGNSMHNVFTGQVTSMETIFFELTTFNDDISYWDTSRVTTMFNMFAGASNFYQPIGNWDTSNVEFMSNMFASARNFNQPIGNWNTSSVTRMRGMFIDTAFNQDIGLWDTSNVVNMNNMFDRASSFNHNLSSWNVSKIFTKPQSFDSNATAWTNDPEWRPQWGTTGVTSTMTFSFNPAAGTTGVAANSNIEITASEAIRLHDNTALDDNNVDALITVKNTDANGANIAFDATILGNVITIYP